MMYKFKSRFDSGLPKPGFYIIIFLTIFSLVSCVIPTSATGENFSGDNPPGENSFRDNDLEELFPDPDNSFDTEVEEDVSPFAEVEEKLSGLTEEEAKTLEELFNLSQEIEEMEREQEQLAEEVVVIQGEIVQLEDKIKIEEGLYEEKRDNLREVLQSYQRMGAATYLEIILESESLGAFLRRLNTLKDMVRNTDELLVSIQESRDRLEKEKERHGQKLDQLADRQEQLEKALARSLELKEELEERLVSLEEERDYYQEQLENMQLAWADLRPFILETVEEFGQLIEKGQVPYDALETTFTFMGIRGSIGEEEFNEIVADYPWLPEMYFSFSETVRLDIPEKSLILEGNLEIVEDSMVEYQVSRGAFYGMPLGEKPLEELLGESPFRLDFEPLIDNNVLSSIRTREGKMELIIVPSYFRN